MGRARHENPSAHALRSRRHYAISQIRETFHNRGAACECGQPKTPEARSCDRCAFLDAPLSMRSAIAIIDALRDERYASLSDLAETVRCSPRQTLRTLKQLAALGRVDFVVEEFEHELDGQDVGWGRWWRTQQHRHMSKDVRVPTTMSANRNLWHLTDRGCRLSTSRGNMTKKNAPKMFRQGDVLIVAVDSIPTDAKEIPRTERGVILAEGEVTGHAHRIPSRHAVLMRTESDARYMRLTAPVALNHEEHTTVDIPKGDYRVSIHHEYAPDEIRRVED